MVSIDLHVHSEFSPCSLLSLSDVIRVLNGGNLSALAITDHNRIEGAQILRQRFSLPIIIGEEIETLEGEIIGLFLQQAIPAGMSLETTIKAIKQQGGLVYLPHLGDWTRGKGKSLSFAAARRVINWVDIVEIFNARTYLPRIESKAKELIQKHQVVGAVASDAHSLKELGRGVMGLRRYPRSAKELPFLLKTAAVLRTRRTPPWERTAVSLKARLGLRFKKRSACSLPGQEIDTTGCYGQKNIP